MKRFKLSAAAAVLFAGLSLAGCKKGDENPNPQEGKSKYVLLTLSDRVSGNKAGYISAFDEMPEGEISNVSANSLEGQGMGGWRVYGNMIFKMFSTADYTTGIEKIKIAEDGTVSVDSRIQSKNPTEAAKYFGTGNFVIKDENNGYYWDAAEPLKIQLFNPTTMVNSGAINLEAAVNERGADEEGIKFRAVGQKFLAVKNGKLFANITYAKNDASQVGFFDDFYPDIYIAVIDAATGNHEKTIRIEDAGSIAYINENHMYDFDDNGDLYIVTQGKSPQGLGGKSKIVRIKASETEIDSDWELKFSDFRSADNGKFVGVFAKSGKLILTLNTDALTGGPSGNINTADIWKFYSVDIASKAFSEITGVPAGTNPGAAMAAVEIDGKVYLRGAPKDASSGSNGYYLYNASSNSATQAFSVNVGGAVSGFHKITIK